MSQSALTDIDIGRFYTPQPVQRKFHASEARYPLLEGGRGGGKSTALLWEAILQCLLVPGANCLLVRRTLTAMEKGGIEDLFKVAEFTIAPSVLAPNRLAGDSRVTSRFVSA